MKTIQGQTLLVTYVSVGNSMANQRFEIMERYKSIDKKINSHLLKETVPIYIPTIGQEGSFLYQVPKFFSDRGKLVLTIEMIISSNYDDFSLKHYRDVVDVPRYDDIIVQIVPTRSKESARFNVINPIPEVQ